MKALSDVELLVLEKKDLYKIDMDLKNEISTIFEKNKENLLKLRKYSKQAKKWLKETGEPVSISSSPQSSIMTEEFEVN